MSSGVDAVSGKWFLIFLSIIHWRRRDYDLTNIRNHSPNNTASHLRRLEFSATLL
jgi:hypothetical protein